MNQGESSGDVVRARRVEIVDESGRVRAVVGIGTPRADDAVGVWLLDADGAERVAVALHDTGPSIELVSGGNIAVHIGVSDAVADVAEPGASVVVHDATGVPVAGWSVRRSGVLAYDDRPE